VPGDSGEQQKSGLTQRRQDSQEKQKPFFEKLFFAVLAPLRETAFDFA
jgi:hypothetical protein